MQLFARWLKLTAVTQRIWALYFQQPIGTHNTVRRGAQPIVLRVHIKTRILYVSPRLAHILQPCYRLVTHAPLYGRRQPELIKRAVIVAHHVADEVIRSLPRAFPQRRSSTAGSNPASARFVPFFRPLLHIVCPCHQNGTSSNDASCAGSCFAAPCDGDTAETQFPLRCWPSISSSQTCSLNAIILPVNAAARS